MTILLISETFPPKTGGSGRWFFEIYSRLQRGDVVIAAGEDPRQEAFDKGHDLRLVRMPLTLKSWGIKNPRSLWSYWRLVRRLQKVVWAENVERIHCGRCLPEGLLALALQCRNKIPYVCYVHGEELNYATTSRELGWLMRKVLAGASKIIANSLNSRRLLLEEWGRPAEQIVVLHPGVDTTQFVPAPRDPQVRTELGWGYRPVLLTVGRLQKRKGHDVMIRALASVKESFPDILYAIVGDGEERGPLQELVAREGLEANVHFLGEIHDRDLIRCYQQCDLFVLPNRQIDKDIEGFGMVLVEAQACGKPVIAGASGGTAETMRIPETGLVVSCEGANDLAVLLCELMSDPQRLARMGDLARQWVVERFDWAALSRQAADVFQFRPPVEEPCLS